MTNDDLLNYIRESQRKGWPINVIKSNLILGGGWSESDVLEAFTSLGISLEGLQARPNMSMPVKDSLLPQSQASLNVSFQGANFQPIADVKPAIKANPTFTKVSPVRDRYKNIIVWIFLIIIFGTSTTLAIIVKNAEVSMENSPVMMVQEDALTAQESVTVVEEEPLPQESSVTTPKPTASPTTSKSAASSTGTSQSDQNLTSANTSIKVNLSNIRAEALNYYNANSSYGVISSSGVCDTPNTMFVYPAIAQGLSAIRSTSDQVGIYSYPVCRTNGAQWIIATELFIAENSKDIWCVDSTGRSQAQFTYGNGFACE